VPHEDYSSASERPNGNKPGRVDPDITSELRYARDLARRFRPSRLGQPFRAAGEHTLPKAGGYNDVAPWGKSDRFPPSPVDLALMRKAR
jgi:hypothetical protein